MWALEQPCTPRADPLWAGTPLPLLAVLASGTAATAALVGLGALPPSALRVMAITAGHGALLGTALAWAGVSAASSAAAAALVGMAAVLAGLGPSGAFAYLLPAFWVVVLAARGRLAGLALGTAVTARGVLAGALVGAGLSSHLLVSASRTAHLRIGHGADAVAAIAYDVGANVLAAECFFRGALFARAQRRWSFAAAAAVTTAAYVLRYLVDPLLPKRAELMIGAVFYLTLLGAINCWLVRWSESLVPGLVSALVFFAAYRTLGAG